MSCGQFKVNTFSGYSAGRVAKWKFHSFHYPAEFFRFFHLNLQNNIMAHCLSLPHRRASASPRWMKNNKNYRKKERERKKHTHILFSLNVLVVCEPHGVDWKTVYPRGTLRNYKIVDDIDITLVNWLLILLVIYNGRARVRENRWKRNLRRVSVCN